LVVLYEAYHDARSLEHKKQNCDWTVDDFSPPQHTQKVSSSSHNQNVIRAKKYFSSHFLPLLHLWSGCLATLADFYSSHTYTHTHTHTHTHTSHASHASRVMFCFFTTIQHKKRYAHAGWWVV